MARRPMAASIAATLGVLLLLAGCQEDSQPRFQEPSESPTASASESGEAGEAQTAEEFIREWVRLGTEMQNTGETDDFLALSQSCAPCSRFAKQISEIYAAGGFVEIASEQVVRIEPIAGSTTIKQFEVDVEASPTRYRESSDTEIRQLAGGPNTYRVTLRREQGEWAIQDYLDTPS